MSDQFLVKAKAMNASEQRNRRGDSSILQAKQGAGILFRLATIDEKKYRDNPYKGWQQYSKNPLLWASLEAIKKSLAEMTDQEWISKRWDKNLLDRITATQNPQKTQAKSQNLFTQIVTEHLNIATEILGQNTAKDVKKQIWQAKKKKQENWMNMTPAELEIVWNRSAYMGAYATQNANRVGVWKVGEEHTNDLLQMLEARKQILLSYEHPQDWEDQHPELLLNDGIVGNRNNSEPEYGIVTKEEFNQQLSSIQ